MARLLLDRGFMAVRPLAGGLDAWVEAGFDAWIEAGLPTEPIDEVE